MTRHFFRFALCISLLAGAFGAAAQKPGPYGFWPGYFGHAAINNRWGIWGEAQFRAYDFGGDLEQLLLRTAVTYNLDKAKTAQISQGYAYVYSHPYNAVTDRQGETEEHRIYQQLILRQRWSRLYLQHRYRLEERILENDFRVRFRYFLGANVCLNQKELTKGAVYLSLYNELFVHADRPVFDRNRMFAGLGYGISKTLRLEAGNMWQALETATRPQLQVMLFHNFNL